MFGIKHTDFNELRIIFFNNISKTMSNSLSTDRHQHEVECYLFTKCVVCLKPKSVLNVTLAEKNVKEKVLELLRGYGGSKYRV